MSPIQEHKFLTIVLSRLERGPRKLLAHGLALPVVWLFLAVSSTVLFAVAKLLPFWAGAVLFVCLGVVYSQLCFYVFAAKAWPILARHLDRQGIADRLHELEP